MNAVRMTGDDDYVIIAVNNITAAKLREIEIKAELFRDPLTGVKNKSAYSVFSLSLIIVSSSFLL
jgi:hypothetical protein